MDPLEIDPKFLPVDGEPKYRYLSRPSSFMEVYAKINLLRRDAENRESQEDVERLSKLEAASESLVLLHPRHYVGLFHIALDDL